MKKLISVILVLCMLFAMAPAVVAAEVVKGDAGVNLDWEFDPDTGVLSITGEGAMPDYTSSKNVPWYDYRDQITELDLAEGMTNIGNYAFYGCTALEHVQIPNTAVTVGKNAFYGCSNLYTATVGDKVELVDEQAFDDCDNLCALTLGNSLTTIEKGAFENSTNLEFVFYHGDKDGWKNVKVGMNNATLKEHVSYCPTAETGSTGKVAWSFDHMTYTLSVYGEGEMRDYKLQSEIEWNDYRNIIRTVRIGEGVTTVGIRAFRYCTNIQEIYLPATLTAVKEKAFDKAVVKDVYYNSTEDAWASVSVGADNEPLTASAFHYAGECQHTNTEVKYETVENEYKHTATTVCTTCEEVQGTPVEEACADGDDEDALCDKCGGPVQTEEPGEGGGEDPEQPGEGGGEDPEQPGEGGDEPTCKHETTTTATTPNDDHKTHTVTVTCTAEDCGAVVSETTVNCADAEDSQDAICDTCGGKFQVIYWDLTDGKLTISGYGPMEDYASFTGMPWSDVRDSVREIVIEEGVTHIGARSFYRCIYATKVTIAASVTSIGASAFYRCDGLTNVEFKGDQEAWDLLQEYIGTNNEKLTGATVKVYCSHRNQTSTTVSNADKTHTTTTTCDACKEVMGTETVPCEEGTPAYTQAGSGKHTKTVACTVCSQELVNETQTCANTVASYSKNEDYTHKAMLTCADCEGTVTVVESCVDEDKDGKCDKCEFVCKHDAKFIQSYASKYNEETGIYSHAPAYLCEICGEPQTEYGATVACTDENRDAICDICGQDVTCLHVATTTTTVDTYKDNGDRTHVKTTTVTVTCDNEACYNTDRIVDQQITSVTEKCTVNENDYCVYCQADLTCAHMDVRTEYECLDNWQHHRMTVCNTCDEVVDVYTVDCVDRKVNETGAVGTDELCDICGGECVHNYETKYTTISGEEKHNKVDTCAFCGKVVTVTQVCTDVTDAEAGYEHDGKCDFCKEAVVCKHEIQYKDNEDGTHTSFCNVCEKEDDACAVCGDHFAFVNEPHADGEDAGLECDKCGVIVKFDIPGCAPNLESELEMGIAVPKSVLTEGIELVAVVKQVSGGEVVNTFEIPQAEWKSYNDELNMVYVKMAAKCMADDFSIEVIDEDGNVWNNPYAMSYRQYVANNYARGNDARKTLFVDMLNYGAAAQQRFNYNVDDLANKDLTEEQQAMSLAGTVTLTNKQVMGTNNLGTTVSLESRILVYSVFKGIDPETMYAEVTYTDARGNEKTNTIPGSKFELYNAAAKAYKICVDTLVPADVDCVYTMTVYNADGSVYDTATEGLGSYLTRNISKDTVFGATINFGMAAKQFFVGE